MMGVDNNTFRHGTGEIERPAGSLTKFVRIYHELHSVVDGPGDGA
jgi:hypothetical protein